MWARFATSVAIATEMALLMGSGCADNAQTIGLEGGSVVSDDGRFSLLIPEGALVRDTEVTISQVPCDTAAAIADCYLAEPVGTEFSFPVKVTYELDDETLGLGDPDFMTLVVQRGGKRWSALPDHRLDTRHTYLQATAMFLSSFTIYPHAPETMR